MLISFLICGLESRPWEEMFRTIHSQLDSVDHECEVLVDIDNGEESSGKKRQRLLEIAKGDYVAFVDDDDEISPNYCSLLADHAAEERPDVVCFKLRMNHHLNSKWKKKKVRREVWNFGLWSDSRSAGMMSANHLCAWKRSIATQVAWCPSLGYGDDQLWYGPIHASGIASNSVLIQGILYEYHFRKSVTRNQTNERIQASKKYFGDGLRCFHFSGGILIEDGSQSGDLILCRDNHNKIIQVDTKIQTPFHTVKLK